MKIFIINSGSSSIKFQLIDFENRVVIAKGLCERIGLDNSKLNYTFGEEKKSVALEIHDHAEGINQIINILIDPEKGVIREKSEIDAVGHRVVHAGENFSKTVILDDEKIDKIRELIPLAPLHNPPNIIGIEAVRKHLPGVPMTAVFDTAFHQTMPEYAYMYPIPYKYYVEQKIRRYGFHGTSHFFVAKEGAKKLGKPLNEVKIITCHLGNGSSMAAIKYGESIDTSMGFTPLEGMMMGTRCGDIDPAIPLFLQSTHSCNSEDVNMIFNRMSGIMGISGVSSDMRDVEKAAEDGNERAELAINMFAYRIRKYIGAYIAALNGVDLIIFTAGIGERDIIVRERTLTDMDFLGINFDKEKNDGVFGEFGEISKEGSPVRVMVIPTNEELEIAEQTVEVLKNGNTE